jgi:predicted negative regulator of RcsB-dependent stress response
MNKTATRIITVLLIAVLIISGFQLWRHQSAEKENEDQFNNISSQVQTPTSAASSEPIASGEPVETAPPSWTVYEQYGDLFIQNGDMIGWITRFFVCPQFVPFERR